MDKKELEALIEDVSSRTVAKTLTGIGFNMKEPIEVQKDIQHLRRSREICEMIQNRAVTVVVGIVMAFGLSALGVGIAIKIGYTIL